MNRIRKLMEMHRFFMTEGLDYVRTESGRISIKDRLYAPIAYCKFMNNDWWLK